MKLFPKKSDKGGFVELLPLTGNDMEISTQKASGRSTRFFEKRQQQSPADGDVPKRGFRSYLTSFKSRVQESIPVNANEDSMETTSTVSMASAVSVAEDAILRPVLITVADSAESPVAVQPAPLLPQYSADILSQQDDDLHFSRSRLFAFESDSSSSLVDHLTFDDYNTFSESVTASSSLAGTSTIGASTANSSFVGGSSVYSISVLEGDTTLGSSVYESMDDSDTIGSSVDGNKAGCRGPPGTPKTIKDVAMGMSHIFEELVHCGQVVVAATESAILGPPPKDGNDGKAPRSSRTQHS